MRWRAMMAVLSAFVGIRRRKSADDDARIHPLQIIIAGVCAVAVFIVVLLTVVQRVIHS